MRACVNKREKILGRRRPWKGLNRGGGFGSTIFFKENSREKRGSSEKKARRKMEKLYVKRGGALIREGLPGAFIKAKKGHRRKERRLRKGGGLLKREKTFGDTEGASGEEFNYEMVCLTPRKRRIICEGHCYEEKGK